MAQAPQESVLLIKPSAPWRGVDLREAWQYRELLYFFVWRDIRVRYKQTVLGLVWAIIQPLTSMIIFAFFFGRIAKLPSDGIPYALFAYAGLLPWTLFSSGVMSGGLSVVSSSHLVTKVYFPRILVPTAAVATVFADYLVATAMLIPLLAWKGTTPAPAAIIWLPAGTLVTLLLALGTSFWISALVVRFRDLRHVLPFGVQALMFATPIVYPLSLVPDRWRPLVALNPMAGVVETFRAGLFGRHVPVLALVWGGVLGVLLVASGAIYFRRLERMMADVI